MVEQSTFRRALNDYVGRLPFVHMAARAALNARPSVFMLHRVLPEGQSCYEPAMSTSKEAFGQWLDWLVENFRVVPLEELVRRAGKPYDRKRPFCAVTFDDGWVDNFIHAFPLLRERGLSATVFLPVEFIGTSRHFWQERLWMSAQQLSGNESRRQVLEKAARQFPWLPNVPEILASDCYLKQLLMTRPTQEAEEFVNCLAEEAQLSANLSDRAFLNWDEVSTMRAAGISFGSHTLNHVLLTHMQPARAELEIRRSRQELQERLDLDICSFSYPWGAANSFVRDAVKSAGYDYAVATHPRLVDENGDPRFIPRIAVSDSALRTRTAFDPGKFVLWCARNILFRKISKQAKSHPAKNGASHSKRIKIVFTFDQISEWEGGTERQLYALVNALDRKYFDPKLCFIFGSPSLPKDSLPCNAETICPDPNRIPPFPVRLLRLALAFRKLRPDIVQGFFIEGNFSGVLAGRLAQVPKIVASTRNAGHWKKLRHRLAFRGVAGLAHHWQCNSRTLWEYTRKQEHVSADHIEILPNAIDLSHFCPANPSERLAMRRKLGLSEDAPIFISVAALTPVKDISTLLEAVNHLKRELGLAQFLILGDGPLRSDLEQQTERLGLTHMVKFFGREADVHPYLAAANFGVLTSRSEGSSNSVLEYMAMALPSVISDIPANRELAGGLFFVPGDAADLAEKLLRIHNDEVLCASLRSEYLRAASDYSSEKFVLRAQSFYSKLMAGA
jgi:glycosyltransferase involved in cell wall biosynthesis